MYPNYTSYQLAAFGVYAIENLVTGADYVGATTATFKARWDQHRLLLTRKRHHNIRLQRDWNFYGADAFEFLIVEVISNPNSVWDSERHWIAARHEHCFAHENYNSQQTTFSVTDRQALHAAQLVVAGAMSQKVAIREFFGVKPGASRGYSEARLRLQDAMRAINHS